MTNQLENLWISLYVLLVQKVCFEIAEKRCRPAGIVNKIVKKQVNYLHIKYDLSFTISRLLLLLVYFRHKWQA